MERTHWIVMWQTQRLEIGRRVPEMYVVSFPRVLKLVASQVYGCPVRAQNPGRLRKHFMYRHWNLRVALLHEGPKPLPW